MAGLVDALSHYVSVLAASAEHTTRAEDRAVYTGHLAEAARMFAALHAGDEQALRTLLERERRAFGWGYLSGDTGAAAEAAFATFASLVGSDTGATSTTQAEEDTAH